MNSGRRLREHVETARADARAGFWATVRSYWPIIALMLIGIPAIPFGGWEPAEATPRTVASVDQTVELGAASVKLTKAYWAPDFPAPIGPPQPGNRLLLVVGEITATDDRTVTEAGLSDLLRTSGVGGVERSDDGLPLHFLDAKTLVSAQPGVTYRVVWHWQQRALDPPPAELSVILSGRVNENSAVGAPERRVSDGAETVVTLPLTENSGKPAA